jgi:hypothetical protein
MQSHESTPVATRSINKSANFKDNGDFAKGNQISVGNRGNYHPRALKQRYIEETSYKDVKELMDDLYRRALRDGDIAAARTWLQYVIGKPTAHVEVTGSGGDPISLGLILAAINQAVPDPETRLRISEAFERLAATNSPALDAPRE